MENNFNNFSNDIQPLPEKPQFLRVLCILSFIGCGLMIICFALGTSLLAFSEETITNVWEQVLQTQPQLEDADPVEFFHAAGIYCLYALFANIISLVGVILMWRLNKFGFFIYAIAELCLNFFNVSVGTQEKSYGGMIFMILLDLVFIIMYAVNLKYMKRKVVTIPQQ
jgi:hypothetical protein